MDVPGKPNHFPTADDRPGFVDIHCHCLPGLDDGPRDLNEAVDLCRVLVADGITHVVATPHQLGQYGRRPAAAAIRAEVARLQSACLGEGIALTILPGAEVRLDERIVGFLERGELLTLGDRGRYLLIELPPEVAIDIRPLIVSLVARRIRPLIAHAERLTHLDGRNGRGLLPDWIHAGAAVQITASSLLGAWGPGPMAFAWRLLNEGRVFAIASDAHHATNRPPHMTDAWRAVARNGGLPTAHRLLSIHPRQVITPRRTRRIAPLADRSDRTVQHLKSPR